MFLISQGKEFQTEGAAWESELATNIGTARLDISSSGYYDNTHSQGKNLSTDTKKSVLYTDPKYFTDILICLLLIFLFV